MITFQKISNIFSNALNSKPSSLNQTTEINKLINLCMEINLKLWRLEDIARMKDLGFERIAKAKIEIDKYNQIRNEIIQSIDFEFERLLQSSSINSQENFYAESPGMLIDRIAILFIKQVMIKKITLLIDDKQLRDEYLEKGKNVEQQTKDTGAFLDTYFLRIQRGEAFFKIYKLTKIYNDTRIKVYIKQLQDIQ